MGRCELSNKELSRAEVMGRVTLTDRPAELNRYNTKMDHYRINEISLEMSGLLEQQMLLLADTPIANLSPEDVHKHPKRNQRLRDLCNELMKS